MRLRTKKRNMLPLKVSLNMLPIHSLLARLWFRKQHFIWRFAHQGDKILYVEPSFSMIRRPFAYKRAYARNRFFEPTMEKIHENIFLLKPPKGLAYWSHPFISILNYKWFGKTVDQKAQELGFKTYILRVYRPEYYYARSL